MLPLHSTSRLAGNHAGDFLEPDQGYHPMADDIPQACLDETAAVALLEQLRWGQTPTCPQCESARVYTMRGQRANKRSKRLAWRCLKCGRQFTVRAGTVLENSHIPLRTWLYVTWRSSAGGEEIDALRIQKATGLSHKSALSLMHKIRVATTTDSIPIGHKDLSSRPVPRIRLQDHRAVEGTRADAIRVQQKSDWHRGLSPSGTAIERCASQAAGKPTHRSTLIRSGSVASDGRTTNRGPRPEQLTLPRDWPQVLRKLVQVQSPPEGWPQRVKRRRNRRGRMLLDSQRSR